MEPSGPSRRYRFGQFELQPDERRLLAAGTPVHIRARTFDLLLVLVENSPHLVTKDQLLARVWPKLVVEENTPHVHIAALRKILGPDAIATISGHGYRFTLEVTHVDAIPMEPAVTPNHNLPQSLTSFIGREQEIAELKDLLSTTRLLTLTGAGGCGKTRLALEATAQQVQKYPGGVWLVELAALANPDLVPQVVAAAVGMKEQPRTSLTQTLVEYLGTKRLLLLLDNAEHVLSACAQLADAMLRRCDQLVILTTSRERLGIAGECVYRVPSLAVPNAEDGIAVETGGACESVRLFVDRARLQRPHFALNAENVSAVAAICQRLDGIPLAIELAAPRLRSMAVAELSRRLEHRFSLLTGGSRTALPRHRTLRSLIDWSYDLLSDAEKVMLQRVAVFAGGWTLAAAEAVCTGEGIEADDVLDLLESLADKSLVVADERDGVTRFNMLETVRHYARDQLRDRGEEAHMHRRHLDYFVDLAEEIELGLETTDPGLSLRQLEAERDNVRAALSRSVLPGGDAARGLKLAGPALAWFWRVRGDHAEGRAWLSALLAAASNDNNKAVRAKALRGAGLLAAGAGDYEGAKTLRREALELWREMGDQRGIAQSLGALGELADIQGDDQAAQRLTSESLAIRRAIGDRGGVQTSLIMLGRYALAHSDYARARLLLEECLEISRDRRDWHTGQALYLLGVTAYFEGDFRAARPCLEESLAILRETGQDRLAAGSLASLGLLCHDEGDDLTARRHLDEAMRISRDLGERLNVAQSLTAFGAVACALAAPTVAARIWGGAERQREEMGAPMAPAMVLWYDRRVAAARTTLADDVAFDRAWREGRAMTDEELVSYALDFEALSR